VADDTCDGIITANLVSGWRTLSASVPDSPAGFMAQLHLVWIIHA
jgi:hypothetical protein